jgi:ABC-type branched-subunit amino acid transport system permease subunit
LGAVLLTYFPEWTGRLLEIKELMFGLLLLFCFLFLRGGIVGGLIGLKNKMQNTKIGAKLFET